VGSLPPALVNLKQLVYLGLGTNSLTGTLPAGLCHPGLRVVSLNGNQIAGGLIELLKCPNTVLPGHQQNSFSGTLPNATDLPWPELLVFDVSNNQIEGTVPPALHKLPGLMTLNLASNRCVQSLLLSESRLIDSLQRCLSSCLVPGHARAALTVTTAHGTHAVSQYLHYAFQCDY